MLPQINSAVRTVLDLFRAIGSQPRASPHPGATPAPACPAAHPLCRPTRGPAGDRPSVPPQGKLQVPHSIAVDSCANALYVADRDASAVRRFHIAGDFAGAARHVDPRDLACSATPRAAQLGANACRAGSVPSGLLCPCDAAAWGPCILQACNGPQNPVLYIDLTCAAALTPPHARR